MRPKKIGLFYVGITKVCYVSTESQRIRCVVPALACSTTLVLSRHQGSFMLTFTSVRLEALTNYNFKVKKLSKSLNLSKNFIFIEIIDLIIKNITTFK